MRSHHSEFDWPCKRNGSDRDDKQETIKYSDERTTVRIDFYAPVNNFALVAVSVKIVVTTMCCLNR